MLSDEKSSDNSGLKMPLRKTIFCISISENTLASSRSAMGEMFGFSVINSVGFVYFQYSSRGLGKPIFESLSRALSRAFWLHPLFLFDN